MNDKCTSQQQGIRRAIAVAATLACLSVVSLLVGSAHAIQLSIEPSVYYADSSEVFSISVMVTDADSLRGYELCVGFDNARLSFVSAQPGEIFSGYTPPYGLFWAVQNEGQQVRVQCFIIPQDECLAAPGEILTLTFQALANRTETPLTLSGASVRDCDGSPILPVETQGALIVIGPATTLYFDPDPKIALGAGFPIDLSLHVAEASELRGFQVFLDYDVAMLDFEAARAGDLLGGETPPWPRWWYVSEEQPGSICIEGVILGPGQSVQGPGELSKLEFVGLVDFDTTMVIFAEWHVWEVSALEFYPVAVDDGMIIFDASWQGVFSQPSVPAASGLRLTLLDSNPGRQFAFAFTVKGPDVPEFAVFDPSGRLVNHLTAVCTGWYTYTAHWNGRAATDTAAPPGVYWLRATTACGSIQSKVVLIR